MNKIQTPSMKYESRFFFQSCLPSLIFYPEDVLKKVEKTSTRFDLDHYYLTSEKNKIIKIRNQESLEIKIIHFQNEQYITLFPKIEKDLSLPIENVIGVNIEKNILVKKQRYQHKLTQQIKLESAKLIIADKEFFTFCLESKDLETHLNYLNIFKPLFENPIQYQGKTILHYNDFLLWGGWGS